MASPVSYIDYLLPEKTDNNTITNATIRFPTQDACKKAIEYFKTNPQTMNKKTITLTLISGDEEKEYWKKVNEIRNNIKKRKISNKK